MASERVFGHEKRLVNCGISVSLDIEHREFSLNVIYLLLSKRYLRWLVPGILIKATFKIRFLFLRSLNVTEVFDKDFCSPVIIKGNCQTSSLQQYFCSISVKMFSTWARVLKSTFRRMLEFDMASTGHHTSCPLGH